MRFQPIILMLLVFSLIGCGDEFRTAPIDLVDQGKTALPPKGGVGDRDDDDSADGDQDINVCEAPRTMYELDTKMLAFEITSKNNLTFGFNLGRWLRFFKTRISVVSGRLDLVMDIKDAIDPDKRLANGEGSAKMSKREFSFELGIQNIGIDFGHYSRTPIAKLTEKGLRSALGKLRRRLNNTSEEWTSVVQYVERNDSKDEVIISAGSASNLKLGDELAFYNVVHKWSGKPCESDYLMAKRTTGEPLTVGKVTQLRNHSALIELDSEFEKNHLIRIGSEAVVFNLANENRKLYQPLQIDKIVGGVLSVDDGSEVDITPFLQKQIGNLSAQYNFVVFDKPEPTNP